jgi:hypothetical protein
LTRALVLLTCVCAAALPAHATTTEPPARYVIAMGYNAGHPDPRPTLQHAEDDAARFNLLQLPAAEKAWLLATFDTESARAYPELSHLARPPTQRSGARDASGLSPRRAPGPRLRRLLVLPALAHCRRATPRHKR